MTNLCKLVAHATLALLTVALNCGVADAQNVRVSISNNAPAGGVFLTPVWVGFHDGSFDSYNQGLAAQEGLERISEDGITGVISDDFTGGFTYVDNSGTFPVSARVLSSQPGAERVDGTVGSAPIGPGQTVSLDFTIDAMDTNRYFSYASMVLSSNDYFVANGNPIIRDLSSFGGAAVGTSISFDIGLADTVNDAGTEVNDFAFSAGNGLFPGLTGGQSGPNEGTDENSVVMNVAGDPYSGFLNRPPGFDFTNLNFNDTGLYPGGIGTVTITVVPEPAAIALGGLAMLSLVGYVRRSRARLA